MRLKKNNVNFKGSLSLSEGFFYFWCFFWKEEIRITPKQYDRAIKILIDKALRKELKWHIEDREDHEYLIKSRQGKNRPIGRSMAYKILSTTAAEFGLDEIGTHTLRKAFGYHMYMQTKNIALLIEIFNHSSEQVTLRYIGVNQDAMDKAMTRFKI